MSQRLPPIFALSLGLALGLLQGGAVLFGAADGVVVAPEFPQAVSDLHPDPAVTWGRLDNGMRYCLMPNQQPLDKVSLRLLVESGSLLEREEQRGLAHFLEHMAFNGTTHFPPGKLITVLQGLGLAFGADTNAHTSFDETVYKLDLPDPRAATITTGLQVMADYAGGMLISPIEVNRERGVILAEMRDRDNPGFREWLTIYHAYYPGLLIPDRFAIGIKSAIEDADASLLRDYYDTWYRPERMVLAVAGAIDPATISERIRTAFSGLKARTPAPQPPAIGQPKSDGFDASYHREPEAEGTSLSLILVRGRPRPHDSLAARQEGVLRTLGEMIVSRRFRDSIAKHPQGPLIEAEAESYQWLDLFHAGIQAKLRQGGALEAVAVIEQEVRRFLHYGPTEAELTVARAEFGAQLDEAVAHAANRSNSALTDALYRSVHADEVFLSPAQERDLLRPMIEHADAAQVQAIWAKTCPDGHGALVVTGADDLGADGAQKLAAAYKASQLVQVEPPLQQKTATWAYGQAPAPGRWLDEHPATLPLAIWPGTLANGVAVRLRHTEVKPNEVLIQVRITIPAAPHQPGLREFAERAFLAGGLGKHSADELHDVLAASSVHLSGPRFDEDGFAFTATCLPKELELCFQEIRAFLTDPGWRSDGEAIAKAEWHQQLQSIATSLDAQVGRTFQALAFSGAPQRRAATPEEAAGVGFAAVRPWLTPYLESAPLVVNVVGDVQLESTASLIAQYFGSLPTRQPVVGLATRAAPGQPIDTSHLAESPPLPAGLHRIEVPGTVARALIDVAWPTEDFYDISRTRRVGVLAGVLDERMRVKIRQELGDSYSPFAMRTASEAYRGFGYLIAQVGVAPAKVEEGRSAILAIAQELAEKGVSDELLAQVMTPILKNLAAQRQQNQYWLASVLSRSASQPFRIEWAERMEADYASITSAEISALAKRYLINDKALQVVGVCAGSALPAGK